MSPSEAAGFSDPDTTAALLAAIVESSTDAIIGKDLTGIVRSWNRGAEAIFGYTAAEMVGSSIRKLVPPDRQDEEDRILARLSRGERIEHFETVRLTKDGRPLIVSVTASPIRDSRGRIVGASKIARDITGAREKEREVARLQRMYAALSQINQAIIMTASPDELLEKICLALVEFGGFAMAWIGRRDEASGRIVPMASSGDASGYLQNVSIFSDDRQEGGGVTGSAFREDRTRFCNDLLQDPIALPWRGEMEQRGLRASAAIPVRRQGRPWGTLTLYSGERGYFQDRELALLEEAARDLSFGLDNLAREEERRRAADKVCQERDFSAALIDSLPGIIYFYDSAGRFLRWNANFERVTGYGPAEFATMRPLDFIAPADREIVSARIDHVFAGGRATVEAGLLAKDGTVTPYYFTGVNTVFEGKPCLVGVGLDISEQKRVEKELRDARNRLEERVAGRTEELRTALERAEAADQVKSSFLATMSHELRTPLNSVIGFTGILLQGLAGPLNAEQTKQLGMIRSSAHHLLELINDVLDISKIEAGQLEIRQERFEIRPLVERVAALVRPSADKKGLALTIAVAAELGKMVGDRRRTEQILLNVLHNAVKFTERGSIALDARPVPDFRRAPGDDPVPAVRIRIEDTGIGIRPEDMPKLFKPFQQIDSGLSRLHEGTGLGLAISRRLCEMLGGTVTATSEWERGSVFTITLPLDGRSRR